MGGCRDNVDDGATIGYNLKGLTPPFVSGQQLRQVMVGGTDNEELESLHCNAVLVRTSHFSVNYADITIRWGLYESALKYIGWPIVPGFDLCGVVEWAGSATRFRKGDPVYGFSLFGAYSTRVLVPASQLLPRPSSLNEAAAAGLPAVAGTALHALSLAGLWPTPIARPQNSAAMVHSAAGGVGSMLVQMLKLVGCHPVVGVVGAADKVDKCGAHHVIDKSQYRLADGFWKEAEMISASGYCSIFDANGVSTLQQSYDHLSLCGRLIVYGFHTNLPLGAHRLNPLKWLGMGASMALMPKFDPMSMVLDSKAVLGFNLSFFASETALIDAYMRQIQEWVEAHKIQPGNVVEMRMDDIANAHKLIQSGRSVGKIVLATGV